MSLNMFFTNKDIIKRCELEDYDGIGTIMSFDEFMEYVDCNCFMDYDGWGALVIPGVDGVDKIVSNSITYIYSRELRIRHIVTIPFKHLKEIFGKDIKMCWYNR